METFNYIFIFNHWVYLNKSINQKEKLKMDLFK